MIDNPFRQLLAPRVGHLLAVYRHFGVHPNTLTLLGFGFGLAAAALVATGHLLPAVVVWWIGRLFDGTDGLWARASGQESLFGAYLDIVCDMAAYSAVIVGFTILRPDLSLWCSVILVGYVLCITSALALGDKGTTQADNRGLRLAVGIAEGGETGLMYTLMCLFPDHLQGWMIFWSVILYLTVVLRTLLAWKVTGQRLAAEGSPAQSDS